jgi:two-component system LytT family sensor kinase
LKNRQLDQQLLRAHGQALKDQLNPHFLFNALNSIQALLDRNAGAAAAAMTARLRDFLVLVMSMAERQEVPLHEELDCMLAYLEIEKVRFGERLTVTVDIQPATLPALVPNLLLQPLIENAVRHGLAPIAGGSVLVEAHTEDSRLVIAVRDNGRGAVGVPRRDGVGLENVRNRLRQLHGPAFAIDLDTGSEGYGVLITLPFRTGDTAGRPGTAGMMQQSAASI